MKKFLMLGVVAVILVVITVVAWGKVQEVLVARAVRGHRALAMAQERRQLVPRHRGGPARRDPRHLHGELPAAPPRSAGHFRLRRAGQWRPVHLRHGSWLHRQLPGRADSSEPDQRYFYHHLHWDHFASIPYVYVFGAWGGRWHEPLRITGPSGRTPKHGIKHMVEHMKEMLYWHRENFGTSPIGKGFDIELKESTSGTTAASSTRRTASRSPTGANPT